MLSKGHHFPNLTLVIVINADQGLFSTDFRGGERLAQSLVQVGGRAGREERQGEVIIQTAFPGHPFWGELLSRGYHGVAETVLAERERTLWPPFSRLALVCASALGVLAGGLVAQYTNPRILNYVAGTGFVLIGLWTIVRAAATA